MSPAAHDASGNLLAVWCLRAERAATALIVPDGCRDLIVKRPAGQRPYWFMSSLEDRTCAVPVGKGDVFTGYRLRPGAGVDVAGLYRSIRGDELSDHDICAGLDGFTRLSGRLADALACLASGVGSVAAAARLVGVGQRTLQRMIISETGRPPVFWLQLARVRTAGRAVRGAPSLAAVAFAHGYADQAHMSRDFRRWLDISPAGLRNGATQGEQLFQPGFA